MMISDVKEKILKLKKEKGVTILAHSYQTPDILEVADYTGDSFQLSLKAKEDKNPICIVAGVHFMAETVKILSPEKKVILSHEGAGCPMAEQFTPDFVTRFREKHPKYTVVAYINTTAALKTVCDVCVTSATAVSICRKIDNDKILFIPDCNLGSYVASQIPEKHFRLFDGGCPIHASVSKKEAKAAVEAHPSALLLTHPECKPAITGMSDFIGSTSAIMDYARKSSANEFIIGTEISIAEHLQYACPEKKFYPLSKKLICPDMKLTTLPDILNILEGSGGIEIEMDGDTIEKASLCINKMLELGK